MFKGVCLKRKSILFVLLIISILLLTLYFQNQSSNKNYLIQVAKNYKKNFDNYYDFFKKELIHFYEIQTIYIQDNPNNIKKIISQDRFLKDVQIISLKENSTNLYAHKVLEGKSFLDVIVTAKDIFYNIIVPMKEANRIISYVIYTVDSRFFLQSVKDFDGSNGIIFVKDDNKKNDIFLNGYRNSKFFKAMADKCQAEKHKPVVEYEDEIYVKKLMDFKNFNDENVASAIFFLDISQERKAFMVTVKDSILTSIVLFILAGIVFNYFFSFLIKRIQENEQELKQINKNLEDMAEKETKQRLLVEKEALQEKQKNEQLLIQQSKMALLGEMIGNIAHQWRQPLMQLSAILMYLDAYNEKKKLTAERFALKMKEGNSLIDFMSKTIEDFRNYYKPEKQKEVFLIKESIDSALFIVSSSFKNYSINVKVHYEDEELKISSFKNEFSQALLNIMTNAKDVLILREIEQPTINVNVKKENKTFVIEISDNAGGIQEDILAKIFDPYFTTKHQAQGTGIGLYMTKMIIENNMNGKIIVTNEKEGAKFRIELNED